MPTIHVYLYSGRTLDQKRKLVQNIMANNKYKIDDFLPLNILKQENLISLKEALYKIHFPKNNNEGT